MAVGCSGAPPSDAFRNKVFYEYGTLGQQAGAGAVERPYPPLDLVGSPPLPDYVGVSLLGGAVHLSRPKNWVIRAANGYPEHRFVEYVSPHEYMVSVYELVDSPSDPWLDVMSRYEDEAGQAGAELVGERVPMATWNAQGRGYLVRRPVAAAKGPLVNYAHEYLLRSGRRVVLVQIVHPQEKLDELGTELRRFVETLEVD